MNDAIETVMSFINENTNILIIICVFLIVVLVAYLIDNAIKTKKINKNIEKEQKETAELIEKRKEEESIKQEQQKLNEKFENVVMNDIPKVEDIFNEPAIQIDEKEPVVTEEIEIPIEIKEEPETIIPITDNEEVKEPEEIKVVENTEEKQVDVIYKNDKKLSEILFSSVEKQPEGKLDDSIVKKEEESISESAAELDAIMEKLNNYNNSEEDNYSNIF